MDIKTLFTDKDFLPKFVDVVTQSIKVIPERSIERTLLGNANTYTSKKQQPFLMIVLLICIDYRLFEQLTVGKPRN
jgi:hypothetical protein